MAFLIFLFFFVVIIYTQENDESKNNYRNLDSNEYSKIRIHIDYSCFISSQNTTDNELLKNAISKAKSTLEKLIKVEPLVNELYLYNYKDLINFGCNYDLSLVVPADLIIFIKDYKSTSVKVDFATSKIIKYIDNDVKKRPIIGLVEVDFVPDTLTDYDSRLQAWSTMFLHEFTHILGFTKRIFDEKGLIKDVSIKSRMSDKNQQKYFFIGSKAVEIAKSYFNCSELPGNGIELDTEIY